MMGGVERSEVDEGKRKGIYFSALTNLQSKLLYINIRNTFEPKEVSLRLVVDPTVI